MEIKEIINELKYYTGELPRAALEEAIKHKESIIPDLLEMLEYTKNNIGEIYTEEDDFFGYIFAIFLLAEFREKKAFPFLIELLNQGIDVVECILGDDYTEFLPRLLASTYNGDDESLFSIIENSDIDEFVRSCTLQTFSILYLNGMKSREFLVDYLKKLIEEKSDDDDSYLYQEIVVEATNLRLIELDGIVDKVFNEEEYEEEMKDLKNVFANENYQVNRNRYPLKNYYEYIYDTIGMMEVWQCFRVKEDEEYEQSNEKKICDCIRIKRLESYENSHNIGRNDFCYCGSGKKYKYCCINKNKSELIEHLDNIDLLVSKAEWYRNRNDDKKAHGEYRIAWFIVRDICVDNNVRSIGEYDEMYKGYDSLLNWIQDYDEILEASDDENDLCERIRLWETIEAIYDIEDEDNLYWKEYSIRNRANAEFRLGNEEDATKIIENYLAENERWVWGYVEMSDWYDNKNDKKHYNLEKSLEILSRAESVEKIDEIMAIYERFESIYDRLGNKEKAKEYDKKWREEANSQ